MTFGWLPTDTRTQPFGDLCRMCEDMPILFRRVVPDVSEAEE